MNRLFFFSAALLGVALSCRPSASEPAALSAPSDLTVEMVSETAARLSWTESNDAETGFWVYRRTPADAFYVAPENETAPLPANTTSHVFEDLLPGASYDFGVQALAADRKAHSSIAYAPRFRVPSNLSVPSGVEASVGEGGRLTLRWRAASGAESYRVFLRAYHADEEGDAVETLPATASSYTFTSVAPGRYEAGVQACGLLASERSAVVWSPGVRVQNPAKQPVINGVSTSYAYVNVDYTSRLSLASAPHGLCISEDPLPDLEDRVVWGPSMPADKRVKQLIPNAILSYGTTYYVCAYTREGTANCYYSDPVAVRLDDEPDLPQLQWTRVENPAGIPAAVEVYATETPLNGRNFRAWYAIADCSGSDVEFRVCEPATGNLQTIDKQAEAFGGDCYVLVNAGYFYKPSDWTTPFVMDGIRPSGRDGYGSSRTQDASWTLVTPGVIGVDRKGTPDGFWWTARPSETYYYRMPLPTVPDQAKYWYENGPQELAHFPCDSTGWQAYNAISAGPMVLYDNRVVVDDSHNGSWYTTNYELLADDIFPGAIPDRTAVGYTADGRMVLFICDGRVDESRGASLSELGLIMKSIGCVGAMNLDGGGSTGMMLGDRHLNTWYQGLGASRAMEYRAVWTTVGFFKKR